MIKNIRVPLTAVQKAIYIALTNGQTTSVYDHVPTEAGAKLPYITIGAVTIKPTGTKDKAIFDLSYQLHCWSEYDGKAEVNEIMNDVSTVLTASLLDLSADNWAALSQDITFYEAYEADTYGYHGVITFWCRVQDLS